MQLRFHRGVPLSSLISNVLFAVVSFYDLSMNIAVEDFMQLRKIFSPSSLTLLFYFGEKNSCLRTV